jgi:hypothetical protein
MEPLRRLYWRQVESRRAGIASELTRVRFASLPARVDRSQIAHHFNAPLKGAA